MSDKSMTLSLMATEYAICRLPASADVPLWPMQGKLFSITRTEDELSIVCEELLVREAEPQMKIERGWRCFKLHGPIPFETTGVIASITHPLAESCVSVFVVSTFDTDYLLVKTVAVEHVIQILRTADHIIHD
jgi:hypothetical protein